MADMNVNIKNCKRRIVAPRIDLTPMVDLGFLLITFFMYTTTMAKAKTMEINMPSTEKTSDPTAFIEESTITFIAGGRHVYYYYPGAPDNTHPLRKVGIKELRDIIIAKKKEASHLSSAFSIEAHNLHVLIRPGQSCTYDDLVSILDEMQINAVPYYAIADVTPYETQWIVSRK